MAFGCSSWLSLASRELVGSYSRQIMILKMWKMAGVVLLWTSFFIGKATPTVYREVVYEGGTSCTKEMYTTEFFGIPDDTGLRDFDTCLAGPGGVPRYYLKYTCVKSSVVAGMYIDSNCTDAVEGPGTIAVELASELCTSNKTRSCSSTNLDTTASHNFSISVEMFTSPSCPADEVVDVLNKVDEFRHPQTNAVRECYPSETLDFNSKLVCADGELKTFYYDVSDHDCMLSPRAVISSPSCLKMENASYNKVSCEASSGSPKLFAEEIPPPLAGDSSADAWYIHTKEYKSNASGNDCGVLEVETYSFGMFSEDGEIVTLGECYATGGGMYYMSMGCNETSGAITMNMYSTENCSGTSFLQTLDEANDEAPCSSSECTFTAPMFEATIDDWEVLIDYQVDDVCSSSNGTNERLSWAETVDSGVFDDSSSFSTDYIDNYTSADSNSTDYIDNYTSADNNSTDYIGNYTSADSNSTDHIDNYTSADSNSTDYIGNYTSADSETAMIPSPSCSASGNFSQTIRCVDGMIKSVLYSVDDINCTGLPFAVMQFPSCLQWKEEEYVKLSCVEVFSQSDDDESGDDESGDDESGDDESGDDESGDAESGDDASGDDESGDDESGDDASGDDESGDDKSGDFVSSAYPSKNQQRWLFERTTVTSLMIIFLVLGAINM